VQMSEFKPPRLQDCHGTFAQFAEPESRISNSEIRNTNWVGFGTYMVSGFIRGGCEIGRYCSIGRDVTVGLGHHDITALSTSSWFPILGTSSMPLAQKDPKRRVKIGHDVWIGDNVKILSGVTVGTGSVLATSAVITKDVEPYSIIGGIPGKLIKKRWDDKLIAALMESRWWEYDPHLLRKIYDADPRVVLKRLKPLSKSDNLFPVTYARLTPEDIVSTKNPVESKAVEVTSKTETKSDIEAGLQIGPAPISDKAFEKINLKSGQNYRADIVFDGPIKDKGLVWTLNGQKHPIQRRNLTLGDKSKFVFFRMPGDQKNVKITIAKETGDAAQLNIKSLSFTEVDFFDHADAFEFGAETLVACIASYPPRKKMLRKAVECLIDQVDQICVFLNGYTEIPDFILEASAQGKLTYLISSENNLRAAGKFKWMDRPGYFLLCDDDIIYPDNYAATLRSEIDRLGRGDAVIGAMSAILKKDEAGNTVRHSYTAFSSENKTPKRVHLLGTGVMAFHSEAGHRLDLSRLLAEPIYNDEIFAVEAREKGLQLWHITCPRRWLKPNPDMRFGIREEVAIDANKRKQKQRILDSAANWNTLSSAPVSKFTPIKTVTKKFNDAVAKLASSSSNTTNVLQIGACDGVQYDPLRELILKHELKAVFFEPIQYLFEALQKNYAGQTGHVFVNMAVTDSTGYEVIRYVDPKAIEAGTVPEWSIGLGTLVQNANAIDGQGGISDEDAKSIAKHTIEASVRTLAFSELAQTDLARDAHILVTDAEGYDAYFLEKISEGLLQPQIIFSEILLLSKENISRLKANLVSLGYEVTCSRESLLAVRNLE